MTSVKLLIQQLQNPRHSLHSPNPPEDEVEKKFEALKVSIAKKYKPPWKSKGKDSQ